MNLLTQRDQDFRKSHNSSKSKMRFLPIMQLFKSLGSLTIAAALLLILYLAWPSISEWFGLVTSAIK